MMIANHEGETISYKTYEKLSFCETIRLVSSDSKIFKLPKILLSFLSRYCEEDYDYDIVFTPLGSKNLAQIVEMVDGISLTESFHNLSQEIQEDAEILGIESGTLESIVRVKTLMMNNREKESSGK